MKAPFGPLIAISNRPFSSVQELIDYCLRKECGGIDYSFPYEARTVADLEGETANVREIVNQGIEIRYHCPFHFMEMAHAEKNKALEALEFFKCCVDFSAGFGGKYMTVHIGLRLKSSEDINPQHAFAHLAELVTYGKSKGVSVCLENLTKGLTNDPHTFMQLIDKTQAGVTFDLGHASACPWVTEHQRSGVDFLNILAPRVANAHVYEIERIHEATGEPYHVAPDDLEFIRPLLSRLMTTTCDWWLIELKVIEQVEHTRTLLKSFLEDSSNSMESQKGDSI